MEKFEKKDFNEVFKSIKTGQAYDSYAEMVQAEEEYDRAERGRIDAKALRNEIYNKEKENNKEKSY